MTGAASPKLTDGAAERTLALRILGLENTPDLPVTILIVKWYVELLHPRSAGIYTEAKDVSHPFIVRIRRFLQQKFASC
jgi:hypothetical protein